LAKAKGPKGPKRPKGPKGLPWAKDRKLRARGKVKANKAMESLVEAKAVETPALEVVETPVLVEVETTNEAKAVERRPKISQPQTK